MPRGRRIEPVVVVVTSSAVEPFEEAVNGIRRGLGPAATVVIADLAAKSGSLADNLAGKDVRLLVTVGNNALDSAAGFGTAPILATMLPRADLAASGRRAPRGAVVLDLALADILQQIAVVLPGKTRAAIIRNPANGVPQSELEAQAKTAGMTLQVSDCMRPEGLLRALLSLKGHVDFVICPPDGALFNSTTVRPLILTSLENRLPVVGFSESFARTGAAAAVYPDYFEVGLQTGEAARKYLAGASLPAEERPHKVIVAVNPRVARLLGIRIRSDGAPGIMVIE